MVGGGLLDHSKLEELFLHYGDDSTVAGAGFNANLDNLEVRERFFETPLLTSFKSMCKNHDTVARGSALLTFVTYMTDVI